MLRMWMHLYYIKSTMIYLYENNNVYINFDIRTRYVLNNYNTNIYTYIYIYIYIYNIYIYIYIYM